VRLERRYEARLIAERIDAVAGAIDRDVRERPLVVVSILKGSAIFMADLTRRLRNAPFGCEFLHVRRAGGAGDVLQIDFVAGFDVRGQHVLLLKDVVHTGVIETYLMDHLRGAGAASLRLAAIVDKPLDRKTNVSVDFSLFSTESDGLFAGYGMAHQGLHAHLPDIHEVVSEQ
jgi:hypoxanthine phosphoribosyltransferase